MDNFIALRLSELSKEITKTIDKVFKSKRFWVIADITSHRIPHIKYQDDRILGKIYFLRALVLNG